MVSIEWFTGPRAALSELFLEADDSPLAIAGYRDRGRVLVARDGGALIGQLLLTDEADSVALEIKSLAVQPGRQGSGIGRQLLDRAADKARSEGRTTLLVATACADVRVLRFYQLAGYRMLRVERDAFTSANGYPDVDVDGIPLRDRVWLSLSI